ncbi:hypothetical protein BH09VER1_BH09VER1_50680 [soil metagenome]
MKKITYLAFLFLLATLPARALSPEIQQVLKKRLVGKYNLRVDDLPRQKLTADQTNRLKDKSSIEIYRVPHPSGTEDYFYYAIHRFRPTGEIWIIRSGGTASVSELYAISAK